MTQWLIDLGLETVKTPRTAARRLLGLNLSTEVLWTGFLLVVVLNALVAGFSMLLFPVPQDTPVVLKVAMRPSVFLMLQAVVLALMIATFTFSGNLLGGRARLRDVAVLLIWMQALRVVVQITVTVLSLLVPALGSIVVLVAGGLGLWILLTFLDEAHGLGGLLKAFMTVFLGMIALAFLLSTLLSLFGLAPSLAPGASAGPFQ